MKKEKNYEIIAYFSKQVQNIQDLQEKVVVLENRIQRMATKLEKFNTNSENSRTETWCSSNIIPFPGTTCYKTSELPILPPFIAKPGYPLASEIPDFRPVLQRNGLILLAWDMRITERGDLYSAYWVTSYGIPRYYASRQLKRQDFPSARPHHKSYAAEDGIEFYGQEAPAYIVHVAPELMKHNPRHCEQRLTHIETLKRQGSKVDFSFKYLLKTEETLKDPCNKSRNRSESQVRA